MNEKPKKVKKIKSTVKNIITPNGIITNKSLPSLYNGNVDIPITINNDIIYLYGKKTYNNVDILFIVFNYNNESYNSVINDLDDINLFKNKINSGVFNIVSFTESSINNSIKGYINAYYAAIKYYDILFNKFNRIGIFDNNKSMILFVNINMDNAFWYDSFMFFGNGNDSTINELTAVDITCHEMTHGLLEETLDFAYKGESGSINEALSDIFGTYCEFVINSSYDTPDWIIGENVTKNGFRNQGNPLSNNNPDAYDGKYWIDPKKEQSIHGNSSVISFFIYLCVNGISNYRNSFGTIINIPNDNLITFDIMMKIIYDILKKKPIELNSTMNDFWNACINTSKNLKYSSQITNRIIDCGNAVNLNKLSKNISGGNCNNSNVCF